MKTSNLTYWLPRVLALLYIGFLALFALDVFVPGQSFIYYLTELFIHLIPNLILGIILYIAWKNEKVGGILFSLSFLTCLWLFGWQIILFSPLLLVGSLFFYNALKRKI
jgi:hypothetical protein